MKPNKNNPRIKSTLYALTSVVCLIWLATSLANDAKSGKIGQWPSIVFSVCIIAVVILTAWQAIIYRREAASHDEDDKEDERTDQPENGSDNEPSASDAVDSHRPPAGHPAD